MCQDSVQERLNEPARTGGETHFGIVTEGLGYGYAGDANSAKDSDLTVWRGVWNHVQYF